MTETLATILPVAPPVKKKVGAAAKSKKATAAAAHPSTAVMVTAAIKELNEKKGSSLQAIKKYLSANYKVDSAKLAPFIRKFLKAAVTNGALVQTNGTGAAGHFKLADAKKPGKKSVTQKKKPAAPKKPEYPIISNQRRSTAPLLLAKKLEVSKSAAKKAKKVAKPAKSPAKAKKTLDTKAKSPKVKKTTTTAKKPTSKKK